MTSDAVRYARQDPGYLWAARQIGIKNLDSNNDVRAIQRYLSKNETPWARSTRLAQEQTATIAQQMQNLQRNFTNTINRMNYDNNRAISRISRDISRGYESRINDLVRGMDRDRAAFDRERQGFVRDRAMFNSQFNALQGQYARQSDAFDNLNLQYTTLGEQYTKLGGSFQTLQQANTEQQRLAANASRASVPTPVQSAELPTSGDQRQAARKGKNNTLSNLTVLTGIDEGGGSSTGLQLA